MRIPKVLAVTKRLGELCATKAMLNAAGFDVATATNIQVAQALGRSLRFEAAIVCRHSFTDEERQQIAVELKKSAPGMVVIAMCPGCSCVDDNGEIRRLTDLSAVNTIKKLCK
jgi:DNA-binding NtrC family response regulator